LQHRGGRSSMLADPAAIPATSTAICSRPGSAQPYRTPFCSPPSAEGSSGRRPRDCASRSLGYVVTEDNRHLFSAGDIVAWEAVVRRHTDNVGDEGTLTARTGSTRTCVGTRSTMADSRLSAKFDAQRRDDVS
jgi:hypothetical protein